MATIGRLLVEITAKDSKLRKGLADSRKRVTRFAGDVAKSMAKVAAIISGAGVAGFALLGNEVLKVSQRIREMRNLAAKASLDFRAFQELGYIASQSGLQIDNVVDTVEELTKKISEADLLKSGSAVDALRILGIEVQSLKNLRPEQQFERIVKALSQVRNVGQRAFLSDELFSGEGVMVVNRLLENYKNGLGDVRKEFGKLGIEITKEQTEAITALDKQLDKADKVYNAIKDKAVAALAPAIGEVVKFVTSLIDKFGGIEVVSLKVASGVIRAMSFVGKSINFIKRVVDGLILVFNALEVAVLRGVEAIADLIPEIPKLIVKLVPMLRMLDRITNGRVTDKIGEVVGDTLDTSKFAGSIRQSRLAAEDRMGLQADKVAAKTTISPVFDDLQKQLDSKAMNLNAQAVTIQAKSVAAASDKGMGTFGTVSPNLLSAGVNQGLVKIQVVPNKERFVDVVVEDERVKNQMNAQAQQWMENSARANKQ